MLTLNPTTTGSRDVIAPFAKIREDSRGVGDVVEYNVTSVTRVVQTTEDDGAEKAQIHIRSAGGDVVVISEKSFAAIASAKYAFENACQAVKFRGDVEGVGQLVDDQSTWVDRVWYAPEATPVDGDYLQAHMEDVVDVNHGESLWAAWLRKPPRVITSVVIGPMPVGICDPMPKVTATFDDGTTKVLFEFFADELSFNEDEFIGLTLEEGVEMKATKDGSYLSEGVNS